MKFLRFQSLVLAALLSTSEAFVVKSPVTVSQPSRTTRTNGPAITTPSTSSSTALNGLPLLPSIDGSRIATLFIESVIQTGVPTAAVCVVIGFAANAFRNKDKDGMKLQDKNAVSELYDDLYGDASSSQQKGNFFKRFGSDKQQQEQNKNLGIPSQQYIEITNLNSKLNSYQYTMTAATQSKAKAAAQVRQTNFERALRLGMDSSLQELPLHAKTKLMDAEKNFLKVGAYLMRNIQFLQTALTKSTIDDELKFLGVNANQMDPKPIDAEIINESKNSTTINKIALSVQSEKGRSKIMQELSKAQRELTQLELNFVKNVVACLGPERANGVRTALLGDISARGAGNLLSQLQERPLSSLLTESREKPSLFVTNFPGDTTASQVADLREEVTAIVRSAKPGDEALVVLQSGGGTVTGYGLAAAQLQRFKEHGMKLTICVEQVAASGGYMMCCVADKIVASPFAVLGSIGVISDIPNFYERLKEEGIEFQTVTAGKFKRTLTPTKKVTREDFQKTKDDIENILGLFKDFVHQNRPSIDIEDVATGETWFGTDALNKGLCDEIKTADEVLMEHVDAGYNVYDVKYSPPMTGAPALSNLLPVGESDGNGGGGGIFGRAIKWIVKTVASEIKSELMSDAGLPGQQPLERRYMMVDDTDQKIRAQD